MNKVAFVDSSEYVAMLGQAEEKLKEQLYQEF